jgi:acyl-coenzyme A synthetase/AMP-(fatty) acid ligase
MQTVAADATSNVAASLIDSLIASNRGDRHAFEFARKTYSYQDVAALMNRTGNMVRALGVANGEHVLLLLPDSPALIASLLGVIKAGGVPVLGAPVDDDQALARCVAAAAPDAIIVHERHLGAVGAALDAVRSDAVVVVGNDVQGHKSFVDEIRGQSSWLAAASTSGDAPALALWNGSAVSMLSHAEVGDVIRGEREPPRADNPQTARVAKLLRAFGRGEEAQLQ